MTVIRPSHCVEVLQVYVGSTHPFLSVCDTTHAVLVGEVVSKEDGMDSYGKEALF